MNMNRTLKECRAKGDTCPTLSSKINSQQRATNRLINNSQWSVTAVMMVHLDSQCWLTELNSKPWKIIKRQEKLVLKKVQGRLKNADYLSRLANLFYKLLKAIIRHLTSNSRIYQRSRSMATKNNLTTKGLMKRSETQPFLKRKKPQSRRMLMHLGVVNNTTIRSRVVIVSTTSRCHQEGNSRPLA